MDIASRPASTRRFDTSRLSAWCISADCEATCSREGDTGMYGTAAAAGCGRLALAAAGSARDSGSAELVAPLAAAIAPFASAPSFAVSCAACEASGRDFADGDRSGGGGSGDDQTCCWRRTRRSVASTRNCEPRVSTEWKSMP